MSKELIERLENQVQARDAELWGRTQKILQLEQQLADEQAKNVGLRELVEHFALIDLGRSLLPDDFGLWVLRARKALSTPADLSALRAHDAKLLAPYQWQPIETAPKDGTEVILWFPFKGIAINGLYGEVSEGDCETGYRKWMEWLVADELWFQEDPSQAPTHWMPLPSTEAIEKGGV